MRKKKLDRMVPVITKKGLTIVKIPALHRESFSSRTILAGLKYEKLSPEKKDLADKLLDLMLGCKDG